jgi:hypothetical protein
MVPNDAEEADTMRNPLHSICPYFAMFPEQFAREHIEKLSAAGDYVLDPFSGRGTTLLEALLGGRRGLAMDVNPVAYCISAAKADVPSLRRVLAELADLEASYGVADHYSLEDERRRLPPFFRRAFYCTTLRQILFLRRVLAWQGDRTHRFITALVLGSLHGEMDKSRSYFSNQMPRTISTKPRYSLKYWRRNRLYPHKRDVFQILRARANMRLLNGAPPVRGRVILGDVRSAAKAFHNLRKRIKLIVTSPPYLNVTSYEEDQWLRLWFLGYGARPGYGKISRDDRHGGAERYWKFLREAWIGVGPLLAQDARIVCRIGGKDFNVEEVTSRLTDSIRYALPNARLLSLPVISAIKNRQTEAFRPGSAGCTAEVDYVFAA